MFRVCDIKTQQRYFVKEEKSTSRRKSAILLDNLRDVLEAKEQAGESTKIPLPRQKIDIGSTLSKKNLFAHGYKDIREHSNSQIRSIIRFEQSTRSVSLSSQKSTFEETKKTLQRLYTLTMTKHTIFTRTDILSVTSENFLEANMAYKELTARKAVGDVYCFKKNCNG